MSPIDACAIGIDVGSSSAKVAAFDREGRVCASAALPMPELTSTRPASVTQSTEAIVRCVERALNQVSEAVDGSVERVALTTQRDTLLVFDEAGTALTPLISWRDRRAQTHASIWDALGEECHGFLDRAGRVRSLASHLTERWSGVPAESEGGVSRHLSDRSLDKLEARSGRVVDRPRTVATGSVVGPIVSGPLRDRLLFLSSGDKNCELLAVVGDDNREAGLSLGSAVSLGLPGRGSLSDGDVRSGVVVTGSAWPGGHDLETGLVTGLDWGESVCGSMGAPVALTGSFAEDGWCLPHVRGALDRADARGLFWGDAPRDRAFDLWAQGVLCEVRRLRPALESSAGGRIESVVLSGGGALSDAWSRLAAGFMGVPVRASSDRFRGAWGAVASSLLQEPTPWAEAFLDGRDRAIGPITPPPGAGDGGRYDAYFERFMHLFRARNALGDHDGAGE